MPYSQKELKEIAEKTDEDPTLVKADKVPGAAEMKEGKKGQADEVSVRFTPVTLPDGESWVRRPDSTLDWKNYHFEMVMPDGTRHDFVFTAKDDGDAQRKVRERVAATQHQDGTFKLSRLEAPKELEVGTLGGGDKAEVVQETSDKDKKASAEKREKASKEQAARTEDAQENAEKKSAKK